MSRYIDAERAETELLNAMVGTGYQSRAIDAIRYMPTADVVEVVRCKDCKHNTTYHDDGTTYCGYFCSGVIDGYETTDDGYCSHGERKEKDE